MLSLKGNSNYAAQIVRLGKPRAHCEADRLLVFTVFGSSVITDLSYTEGDLVVYFPSECKLSEKLLSSLNLYRDKSLNSDKDKSGYFETSGRVKALKLKKEWSTAIVFKISEIGKIYSGIFDGEIGIPFDCIGEEIICEKYFPRLNQGRAKTGRVVKSRESRLIPNQFQFHADTDNMGRMVHSLSESVFELREKYHGTSAIFSHVLVKKNLPWYLKLLARIGVPVKDTEYDLIYASRRVVKNDNNANPNHYYGDDIWGLAAKKIDAKNKIDKGVTLFAEIVGYLPSGEAIQSVGGKAWDYGCPRGEFEVYIYRGTFTTPDGSVIEFTPDQLDAYCHDKGLKRAAYVGQLTFNHLPMDNEKAFDAARKIYADGVCKLCTTGVPREGVVARQVQRERKPVTEWRAYKIKSFLFLKAESDALDAGQENLEDNQEEVNGEEE